MFLKLTFLKSPMQINVYNIIILMIIVIYYWKHDKNQEANSYQFLKYNLDQFSTIWRGIETFGSADLF